jgi:hypothetical protein
MTSHLFFGHNDGHYADIIKKMDIMFFVNKNEQNHQKLAKKKQLDTFAQRLFNLFLANY